MKRELQYQIIFVVIAAAGAYWIMVTTQANLTRLGVDSGFDFLFSYTVSASFLGFVESFFGNAQ